MNRKVLIISLYFPPVNAADMQRVRMSLPYFANFGWDAEVVCVDEPYTDMVTDELLLQSVPGTIRIHRVKALSKKITAKFGLGNLALRSLWYYRKTVNKLLADSKFDLIYFSTTQFPVCILGSYWKKRFGIPYVIDMQDPWHSDYYQDKPKAQQPPKYWFSYRLNKYLEPLAIKQVDGLISVSESYITTLKERYPQIQNIPQATITFGAYQPDLTIAADNAQNFTPLLDADYKNIVYVGRGGTDMHKAVGALFTAFKKCAGTDPDLFNTIKFYFIGTSYAPLRQGIPTILPLAKQYGMESNVVEITDRISYYHTLLTLQQADALFIPGSDDPAYTASKIYPYLLSKKPLLAVFNAKSPALATLGEYGAKHVYTFNNVDEITGFLNEVAKGVAIAENYNANAIERYSANNMARQQCLLFNKVVGK
ncbi:glycosyltransferase [Mucilaginibacter terrigena]|nr:glycosyltransferase [Mucilaginibacter terrigena]